MARLIHLIYASAAAHAQSDGELEAILAKSRHNNARDGVTGMLLHCDGSFFQVLEGAADAVDAAFARIDRDPRHRGTTCIIREPIARQSFREWTMGYAGVSPDALSAIPGLNDFFTDRQCLPALDAGRARKLLQAFGGGRWRTRLAGTAASPPVELVPSG
jgi:hypothetical protein